MKLNHYLLKSDQKPHVLVKSERCSLARIKYRQQYRDHATRGLFTRNEQY